MLLFFFTDLKELQRLGVVYFIYLFLYSGLEFTLTFLTHHKFAYTKMQQGWMFFAIGLTMAILQGSFVRRVPPTKTKSTAVLVSCQLQNKTKKVSKVCLIFLNNFFAGATFNHTIICVCWVGYHNFSSACWSFSLCCL